MSENRDEATGEFALSTEGLYGREHEEAAAGYKPMEVTPKEEQPELTVREAADELVAQTPAEPEPEKIVVYDTKTGDVLNENPSEGVVESLTIEEAARLLTSYHDNKAVFDAKSISNDFAAEVDKMRAEALKENPKLAEHYGIEPPDAAEGESPTRNKVENQTADGDLDPQLAEQIRKHPQVRQMLEEEVTQSRQVREQYSTGLENARVHTLATLAEVVPHLAGLPPQQFEQGLALLSQVDPPAFHSAMNILGRAHTIVQAQQQEHQQRNQVAQQEFEQYGKAEDVKFREMLGNDRGKLQQAATEVVDYLGELGIGQDRLVHLLRTDPTIRSAEGQKILSDAARYRAMQKSPAKAAPKDLPPVLRPGISRPAGADASEREQTLTRKTSLNIKEATELYALQSRRRA